MKIILLILVSLTLSAHTFASWSRFAYVTPKTEKDYELSVYITPTNQFKTTYLIRLPAVSYPSKQAWLIVTPTSISPTEQNQRERFWSKELNTENVEAIIPLRPKGIPIFQKTDNSNKEKFYEVVIPADQIDRTYIYIDFPTPVYDGGYYYSIDIGTYITTTEQK